MSDLGCRLGLWMALCSLLSCWAWGDGPPQKPAEALYLQLGHVGLDATRVYQVRGASLERSSVHISLEDGKIAFTQDVMGRITGAFFEGDGEVLLAPPNDVERRSMSLFTGMAILEEHFATAYFRFNDDVWSELRPDLRETGDKQEFVQRWDPTARNLAGVDAMRLLMSFSSLLPVEGGGATEAVGSQDKNRDRFLHARLQGTKLGVFDVDFDSLAAEQIEAGQTRSAEGGVIYYDVWSSFMPASANGGIAPKARPLHKDWVNIRRYKISTEVQLPKRIHSRAELEVQANEGGSRLLLFELSRFLQVESVTLDGQPVEFVHNPAVEGTQLSQRGNDIVAVMLPQAAKAGQRMELEFVYGGEVLAEAGAGLLYVGERGTWYPNRGLMMANFDLSFEYPQGWTLVATGKLTASSTTANGLQSSRWVSDRTIPVAGFDLGKYKLAKTQAGNVTVEIYATAGVEKNFPTPGVKVVDPSDTLRNRDFDVPRRPSPAKNEATVAESAAQAIRYYSERFGPYPYGQLALAQMPGHESQGWPGLIFLSSYAFLNAEEREDLHLQPYQMALQTILPAHETAHQWWGDLITWSTYRDQWLSEGLANYSAMMMLQEKDPASFRQIMEKYRQDLVKQNKDGVAPKDAGPVTLGGRLLSSRFPQGYEAISYGRATWLFHMLRTMLRDAEAQQKGGKARSGTEEPFVRGLKKVREQYEGRSISTVDLLDAFTADLPPSLMYEGRRSLDWFLDGWVNGTAVPKLELRSVHINPKGSSLVVTGTILQTDAPNDLVTSVPVYGVGAGRSNIFLGRVFADGTESNFHLTAPSGVHKIVLDPYQTILTSPK
ncbi:MAG TPA: M1 family aminopeptidase [Candidatus Sulfotelmatobacter sp.]|nr:M1 family aminopeptidase [Candidatus Sulfotelmatobacter sp.]